MSELAVISRPLNSNPSCSGSVLIIDDEAEIRESLQTLLELEGFEIETAVTGEEGLLRTGEHPFDLVLLDLTLPGRNGMEILAEIHSHDSSLPVIMITAYGTVENAVRAMQSGAANFVQKPWDNEKLLADVRASIGWRRAEEENVQLKRALKQRYNFENIVGKSEPMLKIFDLVAQVAFTSAIASKKGLFEMADRGTLFLDEIATMGLDTQAKILRVLQDRRFMHLGGVQEVQVDVRIIAATNVDLRQLVREGRFREDLFYRLNVIAIDLPPLRQRKEDIPLLVDFFLRRYSDENQRPLRVMTPEGMRPLLNYSWAGNVRELENVMERAVVLSSTPEIGPDLLPDHIAGRGALLPLIESRADASLFDMMEECERHLIVDMLEKCSWNQTETAERFHIPLSTLNQKIKRLNIEIKKKARE